MHARREEPTRMPSAAKLNIKYGNAQLGSPSSMRWSDTKQHTALLFLQSGVPNQFTFTLPSFKILFCVPLALSSGLIVVISRVGQGEMSLSHLFLTLSYRVNW